MSKPLLFSQLFIGSLAVLLLVAGETVALADDGDSPAQAKTSTQVSVQNPILAMSQDHQATCIINVDDAMPSFELPDTKKETRSLEALLGQKLTVVVFWHATNRYALDEFKRIWHELGSFHDAGLNLVAIHVGSAPENYMELCEKYGSKLTCLLDAEQAAFRRVAKRKLPRTYLLDSKGKVLWFDLEYSRTTRHDLQDAIRYHLHRLKDDAK